MHVSLPLGEGVVVDPFMGSGSTIGAAEAVGIESVGVERRHCYYQMARGAVPQLAALDVRTEDGYEQRSSRG